MDPAQALAELMQLSSQVDAAVVLDTDGAILASSPESAGDRLATCAAELVAAAADIGAQDVVTRVEVELAEGAVFVIREGERTVVARTGPEPSAGLVVYDLRTCLRSIAEPEPEEKPAPKRKRSSKRAKESAEGVDAQEAGE